MPLFSEGSAITKMHSKISLLGISSAAAPLCAAHATAVHICTKLANLHNILYSLLKILFSIMEYSMLHTHYICIIAALVLGLSAPGHARELRDLYRG